jgi:hypothetical protein
VAKNSKFRENFCNVSENPEDWKVFLSKLASVVVYLVMLHGTVLSSTCLIIVIFQFCSRSASEGLTAAPSSNSSTGRPALPSHKSGTPPTSTFCRLPLVPVTTEELSKLIFLLRFI